MNIAQSDEAVPTLREAGVVELLTPLLTLDHYQSLKAAMAVTFVCRYKISQESAAIFPNNACSGGVSRAKWKFIVLYR